MMFAVDELCSSLSRRVENVGVAPFKASKLMFVGILTLLWPTALVCQIINLFWLKLRDCYIPIRLYRVRYVVYTIHCIY